MSIGIHQGRRQIWRCITTHGRNSCLKSLECQRPFSTRPSGLVTEISSEEQWQTMLQNCKDEQKAMLVQFTAVWCPPCRMIAPVVSQLAKDNASSVAFVKIDIDNKEVTNIVMSHNVSSVPTFVGYSKTGSIVHSFSGADRTLLEKTVNDIAQQ